MGPRSSFCFCRNGVDRCTPFNLLSISVGENDSGVLEDTAVVRAVFILCCLSSLSGILQSYIKHGGKTQVCTASPQESF